MLLVAQFNSKLFFPVFVMIRPYVLFDTLPMVMGVSLDERKNPQRVFLSSEFNFLRVIVVIGINVASFWVSPG